MCPISYRIDNYQREMVLRTQVSTMGVFQKEVWRFRGKISRDVL